MNKILQLKLKILSKLVLWRYNPKIVGISGSVGKTTAKEAIYAVLLVKYNVRKNIKNYNNEIGLPLTILGAVSPGRSLIGWFKVFFKAFALILFKDKDYPEVLVLEMGIDRPGDMDYLLSITKCDMGVITLIGESHLEFFGSIDNIEKEKVKLINNLKNNGKAILNIDDEKIGRIIKSFKFDCTTFGFGERAVLRASNFSNNFKMDSTFGINFKIYYKNNSELVFVPGAISKVIVYACLIGAAVGVNFDINLNKIAEALEKVKLPPGRLNIIKGKNNSIIIDDTYNSSPQSSKVALDVLANLKNVNINKKYAILGDMLELGNISSKIHFEIGEYVVNSKINKLITVGKEAINIAEGAIKSSMDKKDIFHFDNSIEASEFLKKIIKEGDALLVKGSQGVRMEKIVKKIMAEPERAKELLCRQDEQWVI